VTAPKLGAVRHVQVVSFDAGAGLKQLTGFQFRPKLAVFTSLRSINAAVTASYGVAYDTGSGISQRGKAFTGTTSSMSTEVSTSGALFGNQSTSGMVFLGAVQSFNADGLTINVTSDNPSWRDWLVEAYA